MIQGIIFDCFGVLVESSQAELRRLCPPDQLGDLIDIRLQRDRGYIGYTEYIRMLSQLLGIGIEQASQLTESLHVRNRELLDWLQAVDRSRYKVGLLSNIGDHTMSQLFTQSEIGELFDATVLSYQVGLVKPEPAIYELMATRLGMQCAECVFIDDAEANCRGAKLAGMQAILHVDNDTTLRSLRKLGLE